MNKKLRYISFSILGLLMILIILPFIFKDKVASLVLNEINKTINAEVSAGNVDFSLIRSFPDFRLTIKELEVLGKDDYDAYSLFNSKLIKIDFDFLTVFNQSKGIRINDILVKDAVLSLVTNMKGKTNFDILKNNTTEESDNSQLTLNLENYGLEGWAISYVDSLKQQIANIKGLNHHGSGNFKANQFTLFTETSIDTLNYSVNQIPFLDDLFLKAVIDLEVDNELGSYKLTDASIEINDLPLMANGTIQMKGQTSEVAMDISSDRHNFKELLSILPGAYTEDFGDLKAEGEYEFQANIDGIYDGANEIVPSFQFNLDVYDGSFQYPDLELPIEKINSAIQVINSNNKLEGTTINVKKLDFEIANDPFHIDAFYTYDRDESFLRSQLQSKYNLGNLSRAYPISSIKNWVGSGEIDLKIDGKVSDLSEQNFKQIHVSGIANLKDFKTGSQDPYPISSNELKLSLTPQLLSLEIPEIRIDKTQMSISGKVYNPVGSFLNDGRINSEINVNSAYVNLDDWISEQASAESQENEQIKSFYNRIFAVAHLKVDKLDYDAYTLHNTIGEIQFANDQLKIKKGSTRIGRTAMQIEGDFNNLFAYSFAKDTIQGDLWVSSNKFYVDDVMVEEERKTTQNVNITELIPGNINIIIHPKITEISYLGLNIEKPDGLLAIKDQRVVVQDLTGQALGGIMSLNAFMDASDMSKLEFGVNYEFNSVQFDRTYNSIRLAKKIAPIAKFIDGYFNSKLVISGNLDKTLFPELNSLTGSGIIETKEGKIKAFPPLEKLNDLIKLDKVKEWTLRNTENWFEIKNGTLALQEFEIVWNGIKFIISGEHQLDLGMNYLVKMQMPKNKLNTNSFGSEMQKKLNGALEKIGQLGNSASDQDYIQLDVSLTGNIKNPKMSVNPASLIGLGGGIDLKGKADEQINMAKDSVSNVIKKELKEKEKALEDVLKTGLQSKLDEINRKNQKDSSSNNTKDTTFLKNSLLDSLGKKVPVGLPITKTKAEIDSAKNIISKWNPFKKKKKKGN